ncbi:Gfo/Idh/MocA family protein [Sphingomonas sp.]|uniref:Gfo/Idh/MocA family protein n=1 Tax=Sphingomonas sp. TaxID=28214 RepID=UPI003CC5A75E
MRIAILGPGGIAAKHAAAADALGHELVAAIGRDPARARAFTGKHGGEPFTGLDEAIDATAPDLLIVALPPFAHAGEVEHAAARGLHLLVEKPLALTAAAAERMVAAVEAAGVTAANGFMYRFGDAVRAWREADTGPAGLFAGSYHCNSLHAPWWRDRARSGGQVIEQVIHQIDLIRHLIGEPDTVFARRANLFHRDVEGYTADDVSAVVFGWDDGRIATLNAGNFATPGIWAKEWQVYAERLTGRFAGWNDAMFTATQPGAVPQQVTGATDVFQAQLADVVDAIEQRRPPAVTLADGTRSLKLALAAVRSAHEGGEVRLT